MRGTEKGAEMKGNDEDSGIEGLGPVRDKGMVA